MYRAHCAVIFAIAQLSCSFFLFVSSYIITQLRSVNCVFTINIWFDWIGLAKDDGHSTKWATTKCMTTALVCKPCWICFCLDIPENVEWPRFLLILYDDDDVMDDVTADVVGGRGRVTPDRIARHQDVPSALFLRGEFHPTITDQRTSN